MQPHATAHESLPHWDVSNVFPALGGDEYRAAFDEWQRLLDRLEQHLDQRDVRRRDLADESDAQLIGTLALALTMFNDWTRIHETLSSYVYAFVSTDSYNADAQREQSKLEIQATRAQKLRVRTEGWIGSLGSRLSRLIEADRLLAKHAFFLRETARQSKFLMSEPLEALAADLVLDGGTSFSKLQGNVTSQLKVPWQRDGQTVDLPITAIRNLCFDPNSVVRRRAHEAELRGWESVRTTVAACLNGVKGTAITLAKRRGRASVLEGALDANYIDRATLDAMLAAIREAFPVFRRYLQAKARRLGQPRLNWWDLFAPLPGGKQTFTWSEARAFIGEKFATFDDDLAKFALLAFDRNWIDAEPRDGKRGGAFCMGLMGVEESRVLANFDGSFDQVSTLAHELGHAYHSHCQCGLEPLLRGAPMTLAETASIFCETLVANSALETAAPEEQTAILETQLCGAAQVCLDIASRFQFESAVLERRGECELSADDFCTLMREAQAATYADAVDPATYHPYMWLWKPHYYWHEQNFYNFPYAFGHLFGLGLFAIFRREGRQFVPRYQELLRSTGQDYAAPLAARFGIDITTPEFWQNSLKIIEGQVERFESLA